MLSLSRFSASSSAGPAPGCVLVINSFFLIQSPSQPSVRTMVRETAMPAMTRHTTNATITGQGDSPVFLVVGLLTFIRDGAAQAFVVHAGAIEAARTATPRG